HAAAARAELDRVADPLPPRAEVGVLELRVQAPGPGAEAVAVAGVELAAQVERRSELRRRLRAQRETVRGEAAAQDDAHFGQHQPGRALLRVLPAEARVAHNDLALVEQPVHR